jgi:thiol-disulfide isomerase/thioredoxin
MDTKMETKMETEEHHFALLTFGAEWCSYTTRVGCQINELKSYFPHVDFIFYNLRYDYPVFQKYNVETLPTIILLRNGREIKRYDGCSLYLLQEMLNMTVRNRW